MRANYNTPKVQAGMKVQDNEDYPLKAKLDTLVVGNLSKFVTGCSAVSVTGLSVGRTNFNLMRHGFTNNTFVDIDKDIANATGAICDDIVNHTHYRFIDAGVTSTLNNHPMWQILSKQDKAFPNEYKALMFDATIGRVTNFKKSIDILKTQIKKFFGTTIELDSVKSIIKDKEELNYHRSFSKIPNCVKANEITFKLQGGTLENLKLYNYCGKSVSMFTGSLVYKNLA